MSWIVVLVAFLASPALARSPCKPKLFDAGVVCVCNAEYCDDIPKLQNLQSNHYQLYRTSKNNMGFFAENNVFSNEAQDFDVSVTVEEEEIHQNIIGFGGAFTDSTGINIYKLNGEVREKLLESYFGKTGIQYSVGRVPVGGTDFSTKGYTYLDKKDETLGGFALQEGDLKFKIPLIQKAIKLRGEDNIKFLASAWSAPIWMKTNDAFNGAGKVQEQYFSLWAQYYIKFFDAYASQNISFWGVTTQNEPSNGLIGSKILNNGFTTDEMKTWVKDHFGPTIRNSSYKDLKIILHDDQRILLPILKSEVLSDKDVVQYADGVGIHFYTDFFTPASLLNSASSEHKTLFRLATEACEGSLQSTGIQKAVDLGSWSRADSYLNSIIEDLKYDVVGWLDWNMALDEAGGPTWIDNNVDSPIIVNATEQEFYKQPMFYALGHFSKFIVPESQRIGAKVRGGHLLDSLAFRRPDGYIAVILRNRSDSNKKVKVVVGMNFNVFSIEAHSINTLLYRK